MLIGVIHMVVDHIHDRADTGIMQPLDHLLHLRDACGRVSRVA